MGKKSALAVQSVAHLGQRSKIVGVAAWILCDSRTIHVELNSHEIGQWQQDETKVKEAERYALIQGLRRRREQYAIRGVGDVVLAEGTIQSLTEKYPDVSEKSRG